MTEQEAVDILKSVPLYRYECELAKGRQSDLFNALDMSMQALEKQIPKKPYRNHRNCLFWTCPTCNEEMYWDTDYGQQKFKNCSNCGQKLDWGNEDAS